MITLNTDKGLVRIEFWEDVIGRPGFVENLDPDTVELESIIGSYVFKDHVKCGLSSCHQPHGRGYLVVTKDGRETNIGKDCGKKHFSVDFETMRNTYDRDFRNKDRREQLETLLVRIPAYLEIIKNLRAENSGADFCYSALQTLTTRGKGIPDTIVEKISQMARTRNGRITLHRQATDSEIDDIEAIQGKTIQRPHYKEIDVGYLSGIAALYPENDLKKLLIFDVSQGLERLKQLDIPSLSEVELRTNSKWASELDVKINTVVQALREARTLLLPNNLRKLEILLHEKGDKRMFSKFLSRLISELGGDTSLAA